MIANQLEVAGVNHVITIDLHASQMQGFFRCPVDNLIAEPLIAQWIKLNVPDWRTAVCVSKNPGGTKRTTSLADALKLGFALILTDRARPTSGKTSMNNSMIFQGQPLSKRGTFNEDDHTRYVSSMDWQKADQATPRQDSFQQGTSANVNRIKDLSRSATAPGAMQADANDTTDEARD